MDLTTWLIDWKDLPAGVRDNRWRSVEDVVGGVRSVGRCGWVLSVKGARARAYDRQVSQVYKLNIAALVRRVRSIQEALNGTCTKLLVSQWFNVLQCS